MSKKQGIPWKKLIILIVIILVMILVILGYMDIIYIGKRYKINNSRVVEI